MGLTTETILTKYEIDDSQAVEAARALVAREKEISESGELVNETIGRDFEAALARGRSASGRVRPEFRRLANELSGIRAQAKGVGTRMTGVSSVLSRVSPELGVMASVLDRNTASMSTTAKGAAVLGAAVAGWNIGRRIDELTGFGRMLADVSGIVEDSATAFDETAQAQDNLSFINERLGTSYNTMTEFMAANTRASDLITAARDRETASTERLKAAHDALIAQMDALDQASTRRAGFRERFLGPGIAGVSADAAAISRELQQLTAAGSSQAAAFAKGALEFFETSGFDPFKLASEAEAAGLSNTIITQLEILAGDPNLISAANDVSISIANEMSKATTAAIVEGTRNAEAENARASAARAESALQASLGLLETQAGGIGGSPLGGGGGGGGRRPGSGGRVSRDPSGLFEEFTARAGSFIDPGRLAELEALAQSGNLAALQEDFARLESRTRFIGNISALGAAGTGAAAERRLLESLIEALTMQAGAEQTFRLHPQDIDALGRVFSRENSARR